MTMSSRLGMTSSQRQATIPDGFRVVCSKLNVVLLLHASCHEREITNVQCRKTGNSLEWRLLTAISKAKEAAMRTYGAALSTMAVAILVLGVSASPRFEPEAHFTAKVGVTSGPARFALRTVDIVVDRWSPYAEHRLLETTLREKGWVEFLDRLCTLAPVGSIVTIDGRNIAMRYAWQVVERDGRRRVFAATDEPITLANPLVHRSALADAFTFLELRVGANGEGEGKLSEAARLSVNETQDLIELRDYANQPLHLVMVRSLLTLDE
jgi:hypothetical protein